MNRFLLQFSFVFTACIILSGCGESTDPSNSESTTDAHDEHAHDDHDEHAHPSEGPHHGSLIELGGDEYHAEFVHDEEVGTVTIYILDGAAKSTVAIEATELIVNVKLDSEGKQFKLVANAMDGDPEGRSSRFVSEGAELGEILDQAEGQATLVLSIDGKSYRGVIEHTHDHGHKHE